jgi:Glu-tRNA(Gln) amidotransferase subunit E-like FAD-binding protein
MRTGALIRSIGIARLGEAHYAVGSPLEYALYQEVGTRPHMIYPREAEVLAFEVGGQVVFARHVRHPGFPGRRYFAKAVGEYLRVAGEIFRRAMGAIRT